MFHGYVDTSFQYFLNFKFEGQIYKCISWTKLVICYFIVFLWVTSWDFGLVSLYIIESLWVCMFLSLFVSLLCRKIFSLFLSHINKNFDVNFAHFRYISKVIVDCVSGLGFISKIYEIVVLLLNEISFWTFMSINFLKQYR